jgi:hypothetical protein
MDLGEQNSLLVTNVIILVGAFFIFFSKRIPVPQHTSILTGSMYYRELVDSDSIPRWNTITRMSKEAFFGFLQLLTTEGGLQSAQHGGCCAGQKLMIFLYIIGHGATQRNAAERFQHSTRTISKNFNQVLRAIMRLKKRLLLEKSLDPQPEIANNYRFASCFDKCLGALDGSHVSASPPRSLPNVAAYRNRKGFV